MDFPVLFSNQFDTIFDIAMENGYVFFFGNSMENINCSMLKRKLSSTRHHECSNGGNCSINKRTYELKIIADMDNEKAYIDKMPVTVYHEFADLIQQRYYIRYAEGSFGVTMGGNSTGDIMALYVGPCVIGKSSIAAASINDSDVPLYELEFSNSDFMIGIRPGERPGTERVVFRHNNAWEYSIDATRYNNEDLGSNYITYNLTFVWESLK